MRRVQRRVRFAHHAHEFGRDSRPQLAVPSIIIGVLGSVPELLWILPHRAADPVAWLPLVANMNVSV